MAILRLGKVGACCLVAFACGALMFRLAYVAHVPALWTYSSFLSGDCLLGGIIYCGVPAAVLGVLAYFRSVLSINFALFVSLVWFGLIFFLWGRSDWAYSGAFPWWGWKHYFLPVLSVPLAFSLAFGLSARKLLGDEANKRDQRSFPSP
jgi:hypothetical protein